MADSEQTRSAMITRHAFSKHLCLHAPGKAQGYKSEEETASEKARLVFLLTREPLPWNAMPSLSFALPLQTLENTC